MPRDPIVWSNERRMIAELIPAKYNPRQASEKEAADLSQSLERFSLADPIIINRNNTVIGGHFRLRMLERQGIREVDVRVPNRLLDEEEERELNLRLNKNLGSWDWDLLASFSEEELIGAGFTQDELLVNFGLSDADKIDVPQDRLQVITAEAPEAPRLEARCSFYFDTIQDFEEVKAFFGTGRGGRLDVPRLLELIRRAA